MQNKLPKIQKKKIFRYTISNNTANNFEVHAVVLYRKTAAIVKIGNELVLA